MREKYHYEGLASYLWDKIPRDPKRQGAQPHFFRNDTLLGSNFKNDISS